MSDIKEKNKSLCAVFMLLFLLFALSLRVPVFASTTDGTIDTTNKYAWGENVGWINFGNTNGNIHVTDSAITGYAWIANYGWVNMAPTNSGVTNDAEGNLSGYAWGEKTGWIDFENVAINSSGVFTGTASGTVTGTISFTCANCSVVTDWRPASTRGDGGGGGGTTFTHYVCYNAQCLEVDGEGTNECTTSNDCASHNICNSLLQCVSVAGVGSNTCTSNSECIVSHTECSNKTCISVSGLGVNQCSQSADCGAGKHNECNGSMQCVLIDGVGSDLCQTNNDCIVTHNECNAEEKCVAVNGTGISQCSADTECIIPKHNECSAEQKCIAVNGTGSDLCQTNDDCTVTHSECSGELCIAVSGSGIDQCSTNTDCIQGKHNECNSLFKCIVAAGSGPDLCQTDADCIVVHNECNAEEKCVAVPGLGVDQCLGDTDCRKGAYNACNVLGQCVSLQGQGTNTCQTDSDCAGGIGGPTQTWHNECEQEKCIQVAGEGSNQCQKDEDCKAIIPIITETVEQIAETISQQAEIVKEAAKETAVEVKKVVDTPQGSVVTKTITTTGAVVTAAATTTTIIFSPLSLLEIFFMPIRLIGILLTAFGLKRRAVPWGIVYDSVTKQPLDPAYVTLKTKDGKEISSAITDIDGRYGFLTEPGIYQMSANKTNYAFPSQKLFGKTNDELYNDLYFGQDLEVAQKGNAITKNIPMDPVKFDWNEFAKRDKKLMRFYSKFDIALRKISDWFFVIGFIVAIIAYYSAPYPYNMIIMFVYLALLLMRVFGVKPKSYGNVFEKATGNPLSFSILRIMIPNTDREIAHKVADQYGRYYCLIPKGQYYVNIEKKNDDGTYSKIYTSPVINATKKGIIKENFAV